MKCVPARHYTRDRHLISLRNALGVAHLQSLDGVHLSPPLIQDACGVHSLQLAEGSKSITCQAVGIVVHGGTHEHRWGLNHQAPWRDISDQKDIRQELRHATEDHALSAGLWHVHLGNGKAGAPTAVLPGISATVRPSTPELSPHRGLPCGTDDTPCRRFALGLSPVLRPATRLRPISPPTPGSCRSRRRCASSAAGRFFPRPIPARATRRHPPSQSRRGR